MVGLGASGVDTIGSQGRAIAAAVIASGLGLWLAIVLLLG